MKPHEAHKSIDDIHARNMRVAADKAWETSGVRKAIIAAGTYIIVGLYLAYLGVENGWSHALVPAGAYVISTLSLPLVKEIWIKNIYQKNEESS